MPRAVAVLGMHRSGTSTIAALLQILGVRLGPGDQLGPPSFDNPKGFFEYNPFVHTNQIMLQRMNSSWDALPDPMPDWGGPQFLDLYTFVTDCIQSHFAGADLWAFKDPRCCITLPMWRKSIPGLQDAILVIRNPLEVADSLASRNSIPSSKSIDLWLKYVTSSIRNSAGLRRHVVFYTDFLENLEEELEQLRKFLGIPDLSRAQWQAAKDFVEFALRHHRRTREELEARADVPKAVSTLFRGLRAYTNLLRKGSVEEKMLDQLLVEPT